LAFAYCTNLIGVINGGSVASIGSYAFRDCTNLTSIIIPNSVKSISGNVFYGCTGLTIYTEDLSKPSGWDSNWNNSNRPIVWGCTLSTADGGCYVVSLTKASLSYTNATGGIAAPYREGHTFGGWAATSNSIIVAYTAANIVNAPNGTKLYAIWIYN